MSNSVNVRTLLGNDATFLAKCLNDCLSCICAIKAIEGCTCSDNFSFCIKDDKGRKAVALTDLKVVDIVRRSYLDCTCSKCRIYMLIPHDWNHSINKWDLHQSSDEVLVALIFRMNSNCGIAKHCLGASCCDNNCICAIAVAD